MAEKVISVEAVYASVDCQALLRFDVPVGTSVRAGVQASGIGERFAEIDPAQCVVGIFGKVVADPETRQLEEGDRIEIYRPLLADPKEVRRLRALKAAEAKKANKPI